MRILLYTGKGGVGKTSVSAATAVRCAELGNRVGALKIAQRGPQNYTLDFTPA